MVNTCRYKRNNIRLYINKKFNHPPRNIDNITQSISKRLSEILFDEESFKKAAPIYQKALNNSGYTHYLTFLPNSQLKPHALNEGTVKGK